jgi:hypothetical protein
LASVHDGWRYGHSASARKSPDDVDEVLLHGFPEEAIEFSIKLQTSSVKRRLHLFVNVHKPHSRARQGGDLNGPRQGVFGVRRPIQKNNYLSDSQLARGLLENHWSFDRVPFLEGFPSRWTSA